MLKLAASAVCGLNASKILHETIRYDLPTPFAERNMVLTTLPLNPLLEEKLTGAKE